MGYFQNKINIKSFCIDLIKYFILFKIKIKLFSKFFFEKRKSLFFVVTSYDYNYFNLFTTKKLENDF